MIQGRPIIGESSASSSVTSTPTPNIMPRNHSRVARSPGKRALLPLAQLVGADAGGDVDDAAALAGGGQGRAVEQQLAEEVEEDQQPDGPAGELVGRVVLGVLDQQAADRG